jgi:Tol biopolymer transport system component
MLNTRLDQDLWVLPEASLPMKAREPIRMSNGPLALGSPIPSLNEKKLFVRGTQARAKLLRYDASSKTFKPYLGGISASDVEISRDGQWATYVSYPQLTLWRSRVDGSDRQELTFAPMEVFLPRWSPDGSRIVFTDLELGRTIKIYMISRDGGVPEAVMPDDKLNEIDPTWSPDGTSIVFSRAHLDPNPAIYRVELKTREISKVAGSDGLTGSRMSPDGHYLVALSKDWTKLMLYDFTTEKWAELTEVVKGAIGYPNWSHDGKSVYFVEMNPDLEFWQVAIANGDGHSIVRVSEISQPSPLWMGLAADDSPLLRQNVSSQEIYALDLEVP